MNVCCGPLCEPPEGNFIECVLKQTCDATDLRVLHGFRGSVLRKSWTGDALGKRLVLYTTRDALQTGSDGPAYQATMRRERMELRLIRRYAGAGYEVLNRFLNPQYDDRTGRYSWSVKSAELFPERSENESGRPW